MWISRKEYEALKDKADFNANQLKVSKIKIERLEDELIKTKFKSSEQIKYYSQLQQREEAFKNLKYEVDKILTENGMSSHLYHVFNKSGIALYKFPMTEEFKKMEELRKFIDTITTVGNIIKNYQSLYDSNNRLREKIDNLEELVKEENIEKLLEIKRKYLTLLKELDIK